MVMNQATGEAGFEKPGAGKISVAFRNLNISLFILASIVMATAMFAVFRNMADSISKDYAALLFRKNGRTPQRVLQRRNLRKTAKLDALINRGLYI